MFHPVSRCFMALKQTVSCWLNMFHHCFDCGKGHVSWWFNLFRHCFTSVNGYVSRWFKLFHHCFISENGYISRWFNLFHHCFTSVNGHVSRWFNLFRHCFTKTSLKSVSIYTCLFDYVRLYTVYAQSYGLVVRMCACLYIFTSICLWANSSVSAFVSVCLSIIGRHVYSDGLSI